MQGDLAVGQLNYLNQRADTRTAAAAFVAGLAARAASGNPALLKLASAKRVLLLQGPVGPFFDRLTEWLQARHSHVARVAFQGGDRRDCRRLDPILFREPLAQWPAFFERLLDTEKPDCLVLFGQSRAYHQAARRIASRRGVAIVVTEEGYIRPGHITMELDGVNGLSTTLGRFRYIPDAATPGLPRAPKDGRLWQKMAMHAGAHYCSMRMEAHRFPGYQHHREASLLHYGGFWTIALARKFLRAGPDRVAVARLRKHPYFFVPLQVESDAQIRDHSHYPSNAEFICEVLRSFASWAPADSWLAFKQHPHACGGGGHGCMIRALARELGVSDRVVHVVEGHTPTLLAQAQGVVVINSTVGLQALARKRPLKVMGEALYRLPGLSAQEPLDLFWKHPTPPNPEMAENFLRQLVHLTQVPCHVYGWRGAPLDWPLPLPGRDGR